MPDMTAITAIISSVRTATDIVRLIKESDFSLEKAELKVKLAELISTLADVKIHVVEINELVSAKDARIIELEEAFELKNSLIKYRDAYYKVNESGEAIGEPYCMNCWQVNHKAYSLHNVVGSRFSRTCPVCNKVYESGRVQVLPS